MSQHSLCNIADTVLLQIIDATLRDICHWYRRYSELLEEGSEESHLCARKAQRAGDILVREYETLVVEQNRRSLPLTERQLCGPESGRANGQDLVFDTGL
jgi:hypothetical protein